MTDICYEKQEILDYLKKNNNLNHLGKRVNKMNLIIDNVLKNEKSCRITGLSDTRFLIASHIKPWCKSTDFEKLDGCNGLLLTPNADKLFDQGFISFGFDGTIMVSSEIDERVLTAMGINVRANVGTFNKNQIVYLDYHQTNIFKR